MSGLVLKSINEKVLRALDDTIAKLIELSDATIEDDSRRARLEAEVHGDEVQTRIQD